MWVGGYFDVVNFEVFLFSRVNSVSFSLYLGLSLTPCLIMSYQRVPTHRQSIPEPSSAQLRDEDDLNTFQHVELQSLPTDPSLSQWDPVTAKPLSNLVEHNHSSNDEYDEALDDDLVINPFATNQDDNNLDNIEHKYQHVNFDIDPKARLKGKKLLYFTSVFSSIGVYLFGFEQGVMSIIISEKSFLDYFDDPNDIEIGTLIALLELSAMFSAMLVPYISNKYGRKNTIILGAFVFCVGGCFQTLAPVLWLMLIGRIISGIGIGFLSSIVPLFQSECSPHEQRGLYGAIEFTGNIAGFASSIWLDYGCSYISGKNSWKIPLLIQVLLGVILFLGGFSLVESPRWLLATNQDREGFRILKLFHHDSERYEPGKAKKEFFVIKNSIESERERLSKSDRSFKNVVKRNRKRILIGSSSLFFAQFNGINLVAYYQPMIFEQIGFEGRSSFLLSGINALIYISSTLIPWFVVDNGRIGGRRRLLLVGGSIMCTCLILAGIFNSFETKEGSIMVAIVIVMYMFAFGFSWGPIAWLYNAEIYSDSYARAVGSAIGTSINWFSNFVVGEISPELLRLIKWRLYLIYGVSCFISCCVVYKYYPETTGVELEDMDELFDDFYKKDEK